jgi:hypothetical protein
MLSKPEYGVVKVETLEEEEEEEDSMCDEAVTMSVWVCVTIIVKSATEILR